MELPPGSGLPIIEHIQKVDVQGTNGLITIAAIFLGWMLLIFICFCISGDQSSQKESI